MGFQLIEAYIPEERFSSINENIQKFNPLEIWTRKVDSDCILIRLLVDSTAIEDILDYFERTSAQVEDMDILLFQVEAYISKKYTAEKEEKHEAHLERASRQELYSSIEDSATLNAGYFLFVLIAAIVVTIGLIKNSPSIVIGGMVIAPLLGPVVGVAFASILGDFKLLRRSVLTVIAGIVLSAVISIIMGRLFGVPLKSGEFLSRTSVAISDILLALAAGAAGALSTMKKFPSALVGVMVAVALMPPAAVMGMSASVFLWPETLRSTVLLSVNICSILFSAVIVFSLAGIRPVKYEDIKIANNSRNFSIIFVGIIVLLLLMEVLYLNHLH
ncbi:TIGR00341 family protein [Falsibacillus pallidus]|uniref:Putative hydrophobic protein (TIGR00341 family) n=1 Tax=Falsibacillus pallidus TaxID=493781 RepID=A0A370GDR8_9BACI|nr:TIGR00341 family protein [Falsibacillus pallidus]RDI41935.1 putative hydrophobic protein (TIGR00341 family) [Falsibacillus pallidus]